MSIHEGGECMIRKTAAFIVLAFLVLPFGALAQSPSGSANSIENLNVADIGDDSIVVLSKEETGVPGYVHQKYAYACFGELNLVDYYGAAFESNDRNILEIERSMCSRQHFNDLDTSDD
jgi:hypothetical protein